MFLFLLFFWSADRQRAEAFAYCCFKLAQEDVASERPAHRCAYANFANLFFVLPQAKGLFPVDSPGSSLPPGQIQQAGIVLAVEMGRGA